MTHCNARVSRGRTSYHAGIAAEQSVERVYQSLGYELAQSRWRSAGGEIDLIFRNEGEVIFVEVKKARSFAAAALRITRAQTKRIFAAASMFLSDEPAGQSTGMRFDVALVNEKGEIEILENALLDG